MKKYISFIMVFAIIFSFTGCEYYESMKKVNVTSYENEIFNGMQNHETYNGIRGYVNELKISYYENLIKEDFASNLNTIINEGYDFIWCIENGGREAVIKEAKNNPDMCFGLVDDYIENPMPNIITVSYKEHEGGFLAGYAAAKSTKTGIVGHIGISDNRISDKYEIGFIAGVNYALESMETPVYIETLRIENGNDKEEAKRAALSLYNEKGCDIIFHSLQVGSLGLLDAAKENNKLVIGNTVDQSTYSHESVLCSIIKDTKITMVNLMNKYIEKTLEFGKNYVYGVKEKMIYISKSNQLMNRKLSSELLDIKDGIANGSIIVPDTYEKLNG